MLLAKICRVRLPRNNLSLPLFRAASTVASPTTKKLANARATTSDADVKKAAATIGLFRQEAKVDGVSLVVDAESANRALAELQRLKHHVHAWDTETADVVLGRGRVGQSPVSHGRIVCATCYCGEDADFGNGPRLFIDNTGPADGLLEYFRDYFEDSAFQKVFHNYSFDRHMLARHNIHLDGLHADTLYMARLFDTSFASWEGMVQAKLANEAKVSQAFDPTRRAQESPTPVAVPTRAVLNVRLGGVSLDKKTLSSSASLHTIAMPSQEALAADALAKVKASGSMKMGYELKSLSSRFGLDDTTHSNFGLRFGFHSSASQEAHDSPDRFEEWVNYATTDAVLTHKLFSNLKSELDRRPWHSPIHERPIEELLRDPKVAQTLREKGKSAPFSFFRLSKKRSGETYNSNQFETGKSMWHMFELYVRDFAVSLADLEEVGIGVDLEALRSIEAKATKDSEDKKRHFADCIATISGPDSEKLNPDAAFINIRSSQQLRTLLFGGSTNILTSDELDKRRNFPAPKNDDTSPRKRTFEIQSLGLVPSTRKKDHTVSGWGSTSSKVLERLVADSGNGPNAVMQQLLERGYSEVDANRVKESIQSLREASRAKAMLTGFVQPLLTHAQTTGRIHPSWKFDTSTGRLACRTPNLQNLPSTSQDKYGIRDAFRPDAGKVFVIADYSQLELRVLAHISNCDSMIKKLTTGGDYHSEVAAEMFPHIQEAIVKGEAVLRYDDSRPHVPTVKVKFPKERSSAKAINFGIVFGMSPGALAEDLGITTSEAEVQLESWYKSKREVKAWQDTVRRDSQVTKKSLSLLGRQRHLPLLDEKASPAYRFKSLRAAVNFGIQGSAADIVIAAMLRLWRDKRLIELGFKIVLQVHDEFVLEGPSEHAEEAAKIVEEVMMNPFKEKSPSFKGFRVPLVTDVVIASTLAAKP